ncbi:MAG: hypothetical protein PWR01_3422 [Clostridiales bacterium]|nr:hypothetical protein [Clostridiales bacterium]MDN5282349.1 hypothetical protein [Candidatus Ozemobacter sp.]
MPRVTRISEILRRVTLWCERILAISILLGMAVFFYFSVASMGGVDWSLTESLYELINRILLLVICLELIRTLLTHDLEAVLELLAFVVARKTMKPDLTVIDILLSVIAFIMLMAARKFFIRPKESFAAKLTSEISEEQITAKGN